MEDNSQNYKKVILTALGISGASFLILALVLHPIFSGKIFMPQLLTVGGLKIHYYGIAIAIAVLAGYWLAMQRRSKFGIGDEAETIIFWVIIGGFIGARAYHVISELPFYIHHPNLILAVWNGGLGIFGAGLGGILTLYIYWYLKKRGQINFWSLLDWLTPSIILGQIIGRFGNFINYELYGTATNLPWKMLVPLQFRLPAVITTKFFHPLFLYESMGSLFILIVLLKLKLSPGRLFLLWVLMYNLMRFLLEFLRVDSVIYGSIRFNAVVSGLLVILALALYKYVSKNPSNN